MVFKQSVSHSTHIQQLSNFSKKYTLQRVKPILKLHEFWNIPCLYHVSKPQVKHSRTIPDEVVQMVLNPADSYPRIIPCTFFEQQLNIYIFLCRPKYEDHIRKLQIGVIMLAARNPSGEWRFKPDPLNS